MGPDGPHSASKRPPLAAVQIIFHYVAGLGKRTWIAVFALITVFLTFNSSRLRYRAPPPVAINYQAISAVLPQHPVEFLVQQAKRHHDSKIAGQSKTLEAAITTYRTKYNVDPPPMFDKWFEFANLKRSPIIDDFDTINDAVRPFLKVSGQRINEMIDEAAASRAAIHICGYRAGSHYGYCGKRDMSWYMAPIEYMLPDVEFLINDLDEPRVLPDLDLAGQTKNVTFLNWSHKDLRQLYWSRCSLVDWADFRNPLDMPFVEDPSSAKNLCQHPGYADQHGFILSPSTMWATSQTVPIMSHTKASVFADIIYPNPVYAEDYFDPRVYDDEQDPKWKDKLNDLYWSDSNLGGYFEDQRWKQSHRQRFVAMTNELVNSTYTFLAQGAPGIWNASSSMDPLPGLYNVHFAEIDPDTCSKAECRAQEKYYGKTGKVLANEQLKHRFLMDMDATTYSRRFYSHLQSRSLPFKSTIFQEWHDDRLTPWVHYIPVSLSMQELPEMVRYFALTKAGQAYAQEIAENGREWWAKSLRKEDMQVYMYRLILEYRRIRDPTRPPLP